MRDAKLYYTPPPDEQFNELKKQAISIWTRMGDEPTYSNKKIAQIKDIKNIEDNFMYMVAMFDIGNQRKLSNLLTSQTRQAVRDRMISGGNPEWAIMF